MKPVQYEIYKIRFNDPEGFGTIQVCAKNSDDAIRKAKLVVLYEMSEKSADAATKAIWAQAKFTFTLLEVGSDWPVWVVEI
jgi:hypothetical protein